MVSSVSPKCKVSRSGKRAARTRGPQRYNHNNPDLLARTDSKTQGCQFGSKFRPPSAPLTTINGPPSSCAGIGDFYARPRLALIALTIHVQPYDPPKQERH